MSEQIPGTTLDNKYEIVRPLGSGGMGDVYLVRHLHLEQQRVVKILRQELATNEAAQKRFLREAQLATHIKHPNVAILYDYSRLPDGSFYMVSEYIEGDDVGQWLERYGPFPVPAALQLSIQALRGLEAIHSAGVVHRDISPDNLMITRDLKGRYLMKIIDLGLAKSLSPDPEFEITQAGMFMGKLQYCSPEQVGLVKGQTLDRRTDIYSFGMVLYEMITGMQPFASDDPQGFIFKRLSEESLPMNGRNPAVRVPETLEEVVRRAMDRDREARIPDAIEFIRAIEPIESALRRAEPAQARSSIGAAVLTTASGSMATVAPDPVVGPMPTSVPRSPSSSPAAPRTQGSRSAISRAEREELLAEIDRAAQRVRQTSKMVQLAEKELREGNITKAEELVSQLDLVSPKAPGLSGVKEKIRRAKSTARAAEPPASSEADQAALQVREMSKLSSLAEEALKAGDFQEAQRRLERLREAFPSAPTLMVLGERIQKAMAEKAASTATATATMPAPAPASAAPLAESPAHEAGDSEAPEDLSSSIQDLWPSTPPEPLSIPELSAAAPEAPAPPEALALSAQSEPTPPEPEPVAAPPQGPSQVQQAEQMLERYLQKGQRTLADLALSTLLEVAPSHPRRDEYESWVRIVGEEQEQKKKADRAVEKGRRAIEKGDIKAARKQLEAAARFDPSGAVAEAFLAELEEAEQDFNETAEFETLKERFDTSLADERLEQADKELSEMSKLGLPNLTLSLYQNRLEEAQLERAFQRLLENKDWAAARDIAHRLNEAHPQSQKSAAMFAQVNRQEHDYRREVSITEGTQQVEIFLQSGDVDQAALALKILKQMDPDNPRWQSYERKILGQRQA